jgi:hypothetical protein
MCIFLGEIKWRNWKPNEEYLDSIKDITSITKLIYLMKKFEYKWDMLTILGREVFWDRWQMPDISLKTMEGDCEDAAILAVDILGRSIKRTDSMMMIAAGIDSKNKLSAHSIAVIPDGSTLNVISNSQYFTGFESLQDIGEKWYPVKLIYKKLYSWQGRRL